MQINTAGSPAWLREENYFCLKSLEILGILLKFPISFDFHPEWSF